MSAMRIVTLAGVDYPVGNFTIGQIAKIAPLLKQADDKFIGEMETTAQSAATTTIVWTGLQSGGYAGTYEDFMNLRGTSKYELRIAQQQIGRMIGAYKEADDKTGEVQGDGGSPLAT